MQYTKHKSECMQRIIKSGHCQSTHVDYNGIKLCDLDSHLTAGAEILLQKLRALPTSDLSQKQN